MHRLLTPHVIGNKGQIWLIPMGGSADAAMIEAARAAEQQTQVAIDPGSGFPTATPGLPAPAANGGEPQRQLPPRDPETGRFTSDDMAKARQEEKDKLYPRLSKMEEELKALREEREARLKAEEEARRQAEEANEAQRLAEMSATERVAEVESRFTQQLEAMRTEREAERKVLEMERAYTQLQQYQAQRMAEDGEKIMPELRDLVSGTSPEEIDASIARLIERTSAIVSAVQSAQQSARAAQPGASITAPPTGPIEQNESGYQTYSPEDLANMDMATYIKNRDKLLGAASRNQGRGLFS